MAGSDEIKFWIMSWGSHALVLEPETLRDEIQTEVETMLEKYSVHAKADGKPITA